VELAEFPYPVLQGNDLLVRVEACGMCGSDPHWYRAKSPLRYPVILGHEIVGIVEEAGPGGTEHHGVEVGTRVVVEYPIKCGRCWYCLNGAYRHCVEGKGLGYGSLIPTTTWPSLWGGYAEFVYVGSGSVVHSVPPSVPASTAFLACAVLGNGIRWLRGVGAASIGETAVIFGPGPQGIGALIAALEAGCSPVVAIGAPLDRARLSLMKELGAHVTLVWEEDDVIDEIRDLTNGRMADVAIDVTGNQSVAPEAVRSVGRLGRVVVAGVNGLHATSFVLDDLVDREITLFGVNTHQAPAAEAALRVIASGRYPLDRLITHRYRLDDIEEALRCAGRELSDQDPMKVVVHPDGPP
jgi:alcohol dehydrogenase